MVGVEKMYIITLWYVFMNNIVITSEQLKGNFKYFPL